MFLDRLATFRIDLRDSAVRLKSSPSRLHSRLAELDCPELEETSTTFDSPALFRTESWVTQGTEETNPDGIKHDIHFFALAHALQRSEDCTSKPRRSRSLLQT
jgi:hypothetical protein